MGSLLLVIAVAALATIWVRNTRASRHRWLVRLNLPGTWECDGDTGRSVLELSGDLAAGRYVERSGADVERGDWVLHGEEIEFMTGEKVVSCTLRRFDDGSIGIDGPGRVRRIYQRRTSNVVPLKRAR